MPLIKVGSCSNCGKCCLPPVMVENPCIDLGEDRCKFYRDEVGPEMYGHCLVLGRGAKPIKTVKDRFGNKITDEQIVWFNDNCLNYPSVEDIEAGHQLLPECSFSFEVVTDA